MSRPFAKYPAKPAFGQVKEPLEAGEYIRHKKIKNSFCAPNICHPNKNVYSQSNLMDLKTANNLAFYPCQNVFEHDQLYSNLYTKLDLSGNVLVIANLIPKIPKTYPAPISETLPPLLTYYIDLSGNLFGNTVCGINNFEKYIVYNPPYQNNNPGYIDHL
jgi:hypothetical protein